VLFGWVEGGREAPSQERVLVGRAARQERGFRAGRLWAEDPFLRQRLDDNFDNDDNDDNDG
jgi:hypothetical protein